MSEELKLFTCTDADIGRHVRQISTGDIGIVRKDPGNGWVHPAVVYEWKGYVDDLEYVIVTRATPHPRPLRELIAQGHKQFWVKDGPGWEIAIKVRDDCILIDGNVEVIFFYKNSVAIPILAPDVEVG